jgi:MFS family permease
MGASLVSPLLDSLVSVYGVSEARIGLVMAAFTAPAIVAIPLVGLVADRYGRNPVLTAGLAVFGTAGAALAFTTDFRAVVALRFLQGVGHTGVASVLIVTTGGLFAGDREATAQGLRFTTVGLSLALVPVLAGLLVALAWQYPFTIYALGLPSSTATTRSRRAGTGTQRTVTATACATRSAARDWDSCSSSGPSPRFSGSAS